MAKSNSQVSAIVITATLLAIAGCDRFRSADQRIARAEQRLATGDQFGAIIDLKDILSSEPKNVRARLLLAELSLRAGDAKGARKEISQALAAGASAQQTAKSAAEVRLALNEFGELLIDLDEGRLPLPVPEQQMYRGFALLGQNHLDAASDAFHTALSADPKLSRAHVGLALASATQGHVDTAMTELDAALKLTPGDANALLLSGELSMQRGDLQIAERTLIAARANASQQLKPADTIALLGSLADTQISLGKLADARSTQADLVKRVPDSPLVRILGARIAMAEKNYPVAVSEAQKALIASPDAPQLKFLLGAALLANGNLNQAEAEVSELLREVPDNAAARKLHAQINLRLKPPPSTTGRIAVVQKALGDGDRATAVSELEAMCRNDARIIDARLMLALLYLQDKRLSDGQKLLLEATAAGESSPAIILAAGRVYLEAGYTVEALERFLIAAQRSRNTAEPWLYAARAQMQLGDNAAARTSAQRALAIQPESLAVAATLITLELREGKSAQAQARIAELKKQHPGDPNVAIQEGDVDMASKSFGAAAAVYEVAYKSLPSGAAALRNYRAKTLAELPDRTALLEDWLRREPGDVGARMALADALSEGGATDRAIGHYELLTQQQKPNAMVLNNLAWLYLLAKDGRAEATARSAFELAPNDPRIADTYGWILVQQGKPEAGLPILQRAAAGANVADSVRYHYAAALARTGQHDEARQALQRLVSANGPESDKARQLLRELGG